MVEQQAIVFILAFANDDAVRSQLGRIGRVSKQQSMQLLPQLRREFGEKIKAQEKLTFFFDGIHLGERTWRTRARNSSRSKSCAKLGLIWKLMQYMANLAD